MLAEELLLATNLDVPGVGGGAIPGMMRTHELKPPVSEPRVSREACSFPPAHPIDKGAKMMTTLGFATNMRFPRSLQTPGGFLHSFLHPAFGQKTRAVRTYCPDSPCNVGATGFEPATS